MSRYIIEPRADKFVIIDTKNDNKVHSTHPDAAAAGVQLVHLNAGMKVGAPITPDVPPWSPLDKP